MQKKFGKTVLDTETAEFLGWLIEGGRVVYAAYLQDKVLFAHKVLPNGREDIFPVRPTRVRDMAGHIHAMCNHLTPDAYWRHIRGTYLERTFGVGLNIAA
jgi:hypothetical protein